MNLVNKLVIGILAVILISLYVNRTNSLRYAFYDEWLWISRSCFTELVLRADFKNNMWQTMESYDQPKLAEFMYGLWLYPRYLLSNEHREGLDYTKWLIANGMGEFDYPDGVYREYNQKTRVLGVTAQILPYDALTSQEFVERYGSSIEKTISLINFCRKINIFWLFINAVVIFLIGKIIWKNYLYSTMFAVFVGTNTLVVDAGLLAHSDGLFVTLFNATLLCLLLFLKSKHKKYLVLSSILAGLTMATKLNGSMLILIVVFLIIWQWIIKQEKVSNLLSNLIIFTIIPFAVFVILNPFCYASPLKNMMQMFDHRTKSAMGQVIERPTDYLSTPVERIAKIADNFFGSDFVYFNYPVNWPLVNNQMQMVMKVGALLLFVLGLAREILNKQEGGIGSALFITGLSVALITMSQYLVLDWYRYYIHLVIFVVYFQICGLIAISSAVSKKLGML